MYAENYVSDCKATLTLNIDQYSGFARSHWSQQVFYLHSTKWQTEKITEEYLAAKEQRNQNRAKRENLHSSDLLQLQCLPDVAVNG